MWRMITSGDSDIRVNIESVEANDELGVANVVDENTFRETGRHVRNAIKSRFRFRNGRISDHRDASGDWYIAVC
jgi:ketosteroid isomerase-like protein